MVIVAVFLLDNILVYAIRNLVKFWRRGNIYIVKKLIFFISYLKRKDSAAIYSSSAGLCKNMQSKTVKRGSIEKSREL